jgi:hypothetical protein
MHTRKSDEVIKTIVLKIVRFPNKGPYKNASRKYSGYFRPVSFGVNASST